LPQRRQNFGRKRVSQWTVSKKGSKLWSSWENVVLVQKWRKLIIEEFAITKRGIFVRIIGSLDMTNLRKDISFPGSLFFSFLAIDCQFFLALSPCVTIYSAICKQTIYFVIRNRAPYILDLLLPSYSNMVICFSLIKSSKATLFSR
jgi:hypothetical protein